MDRNLLKQSMTKTLILDGKAVAQARRAILSEKVAEFVKAKGRPPGLAVVIVGQDPASQIYVKNKVKACAEAGIASFHLEKPATLTQGELLKIIDELNSRAEVDGILVQLPLPKGLNETEALERIKGEKDPDGLSSANLGLLIAGRTRVAPCTPLGVMKIFEHYKIAIAGKHAVVVGRSNIVGKPMAQLLLQANATVTMAHSKTHDLEAVTREADIVVVAVGQRHLLGKSAFKKGVVIADVGMHRGEKGLCGDVRLEELHGWASAMTPVPGGVGPMTIQMLLENTFRLAGGRI